MHISQKFISVLAIGSSLAMPLSAAAGFIPAFNWSVSTPLYQRSNLSNRLADNLLAIDGVKWTVSATSGSGSRATDATKSIGVTNKFVRFESHQGNGAEAGSGVVSMPQNVNVVATAATGAIPSLLTQFFQLRQAGVGFDESVSVYYRISGSNVRQPLTTLHFSYDSAKNKIFLKETSRSNGALVGTEGDPIEGQPTNAVLGNPKLYDPGFEIGFVPTQLQSGNGFETSKLFVSLPDLGTTPVVLEFEVNHKGNVASELVIGPAVQANARLGVVAR